MHVFRINECITYLCSDSVIPHGFFKKIGLNKNGFRIIPADEYASHYIGIYYIFRVLGNSANSEEILPFFLEMGSFFELFMSFYRNNFNSF